MTLMARRSLTMTLAVFLWPLLGFDLNATAGDTETRTVQVSPAGMSAQSPDMAIGTDGSVNIVWLGENTAPPNAEQIAKRGHSHDSSTNLYFARSTDGGKSFSPALQLNDSEGGVWGFAISKPRIAVGPDGALHVLFPGNSKNSVSGESETVALYVRSSPGSDNFSLPQRLNVDALTDKPPKDDGGSFATIAVDRKNTVYAAWIDTRSMVNGETARAALAVSTDGGRAFAADFEILPDLVCPCCQLSSAIDARDRLVLGARLVDGPYRDNEILALRDKGRVLDYRRRVSGARWQLEGCPRKPTAIAIHDRNWIAAYYSAAEQPDGVYTVHSVDGGQNWSAPRAMHPGVTLSDAPTLVFAGTRLFAVWQARNGSDGFRLYVSHSDDFGNSFTSPVPLPIPPGVSRLPVLGAHKDGSIQIAWQHDRSIQTLRWRP